jgi:hypothetical protein
VTIISNTFERSLKQTYNNNIANTDKTINELENNNSSTVDYEDPSMDNIDEDEEDEVLLSTPTSAKKLILK